MTKKEILKKLEDKEITVEEAMKLLEGVEDETTEDIEVVDEKISKNEEKHSLFKKGKKKFLRIEVEDKEDGDKVQVKVPVSVVKLAKKFGAHGNFNIDGVDVLNEIDIDEILELIENEEDATLVDVVGKNGEKVRIYFD
ncbi:MAG: hypothetical protein PHD50_01840 [Bacilli bacterium]|nr:hypothetical protein [Bacilli bacterium]